MEEGEGERGEGEKGKNEKREAKRREIAGETRKQREEKGEKGN